MRKKVKMAKMNKKLLHCYIGADEHAYLKELADSELRTASAMLTVILRQIKANGGLKVERNIQHKGINSDWV